MSDDARKTRIRPLTGHINDRPNVPARVDETLGTLPGLDLERVGNEEAGVSFTVTRTRTHLIGNKRDKIARLIRQILPSLKG